MYIQTNKKKKTRKYSTFVLERFLYVYKCVRNKGDILEEKKKGAVIKKIKI